MFSTLRRRLPQSVFRAAPLVLALGCASPGPPQPPSLYLPSPAKNLQAQRVGEAVVLTWTTPDDTTDHQAVRLPITAVVCMETMGNPRNAGQSGPQQPHAAPCVAVLRQVVTPGETRVRHPLPAGLLADPPQLLMYRVELQNKKGRFAPAPPPAYAASGTAPSPVGAIHVKPTRAGAAIEWNAQGSSALMELRRTLLAEVDAAPPQPAGETLPAQKAREATVTLRARPTRGGEDTGGLIDATAKAPNTYAYVAQRVRIATLSGHTLELRGDPSPPVVFMDHDIFPPAAVSGLTSIASTGFTGPPSIDLSWEPSAEPDLAGYNVYRSDSAAGPFRRLNGELLAGPAYRDLAVEPGHTYRYYVTALDERQNESEAGRSIQETLNK